MEKFLQDLRFALRVYAKNRLFTIVAVLTLAIGIGSNIAVFTVVNAMLFRSLPYPDGDRLVQVGRSLNEGPAYTMSYARFRFLEQNNRAFESLAAYDVVGSSLSITLGETPELVAEMLSGLTAQQKTYATLMTFFAAVALFLGAVGLHGVMSHSVAERRRELGIRCALGASRGRLLWLMVTYGLKLLVPGLVAGVMLSLALRSVVASYLFGVSTTYALVYLAVILLLSLIAMIATLGPALRATRVDLTAVLRW